jgi:hypothetical protein
MSNAYKILVGKPEAKKLLERSRYSLEDNIKPCFGEIGFIWLRLATEGWLSRTQFHKMREISLLIELTAYFSKENFAP